MRSAHFQYTSGDNNFKGTVYSKKEWTQPKPAILIYHAFEGMNPLMTANAKHIVEEMGYVAVTLDLYGNGEVMETLDTCLEHCMALIQDRQELLNRLQASVQAAGDQSQVDADNMGAIGFCFGGLCVLDLARAGTNLKGVVSAHGIYAPNDAVPNKTISAKILACHGYEDPQVPAEQISGFMKEMNDANADWQFVTYGHTKHAFTDPDAAKIGPPEMGREYNAKTTDRVWRLAKDFFAECF